MPFAETLIQIDSASLIAGLTAGGGAIAGGLVGAAKLITAVITRLHQENRQDRTELMKMVASQWEHLNRLAQNTRSIAAAMQRQPATAEEVPG